jgi:ribosomal protein S18 acetylase RimI-like enzyme
MTREERIELSDLNHAEANREFARRAGGAVHDEEGLLLWASPHPLAVQANGSLRTASRLGPEDVLERARTFFSARRRGFTIVARAHADQDLMRVALDAGLEQWGNAPAMMLDHRLPERAPPPGAIVTRVETEDDVGAFAAVMAAAYSTYGMPPDVAPAIFSSRDVLIAPHMVAFLARLEEGAPAAGAMMILTHGVAGIYWVGTIPTARGRGLAEACTRAAGNAGFDLGARVAALQASEMGEPVYRRMGYVELTRYPSFVQWTTKRS